MPEGVRFARRVFIKAKPDKAEELVSVLRGEIYPQLSKESGLRRIYLLKDITNRDHFFSLTLWDSWSDAAAYENSGHYATNRDRVRGYLEDDPVMSQFEVEYHTVSPSVPAPRGRPKCIKRLKPTKRRRPATRRR